MNALRDLMTGRAGRRRTGGRGGNDQFIRNQASMTNFKSRKGEKEWKQESVPTLVLKKVSSTIIYEPGL